MHDTAPISSSASRDAVPASTRDKRAAARPLASPRYLVCLAVLVGSALSMQALANAMGAYFRKEPVPLKQSLALLADSAAMRPQYEPHPNRPAPLSHDVEDTLGTKDYVSMRWMDMSRARSDPLRVAHVFISYYTGAPDMVPHRPEECIGAAGGVLRLVRETPIKVTGVGAPDDQVIVRTCVFDMPGPKRGSGLAAGATGPTLTVMYFFHVNGKFLKTRNEVRMELNSLQDRYAYYAKIEVNFSDQDMTQLADTLESEKAIQPLLQKLLPTLLADYFQDFSALRRGAPPVLPGGKN